ncbi:hypothetical protein [Streptococcus pseudoporcinus]|nr:hypothetical protein [Streptococcus pseudoporcinus]EFR44984.1 hypothetical protein HMPREF9320_1076 [Streptococcus pseudoporcinus SPIN 20026]EHI65258.1 hypothetical protein STRPS_1229 [Streptococcus pseudoporcinus LQ 940-04]
MIRYKNGQYDIQINLKDFDFALHLDTILAWKKHLITILTAR